MHAGSRYFGHPWKKGDVVGCMINMEDKSMIFTLNGELLITNKGSELCFTDFETEEGAPLAGSVQLQSSSIDSNTKAPERLFLF